MILVFSSLETPPKIRNVRGYAADFGGFQTLSPKPKAQAEAIIRNPGGYGSYFGDFRALSLGLRAEAKLYQKCKGPRFFVLVVSMP